MIIFLKTGGDVAYVSDKNIHLGSDKANSLFVVAPYASASSVCVAFKLPNGKTLGPGFVENQGAVTFDHDEDGVYAMQNVIKGDGYIPGYTFKGQNLSAWSYDIQSALTGVSGTLGIQLFIFADGRCISTDLINAPINVGVNNLIIPSEPTEEGDIDIFNEIIRYLTETNTYMTGIKQEATAAATEAASSATAAAGSAESAAAAAGSAIAAEETAASYANEAQAWANGTYIDEEGNLQLVAEGTEQYQNNAEYYAKKAAGSAETAVSSAKEAEDYATITAPNNATAAAQAVLADTENRLDNVEYIIGQLGTVTEQRDYEVAYKRVVPSRSDLFAYLNSIHGIIENPLTVNNLLDSNEYTVFEGALNTITQQNNGNNRFLIVNNKDTSISVSGKATITDSGIKLVSLLSAPIETDGFYFKLEEDLPEGFAIVIYSKSDKNQQNGSYKWLYPGLTSFSSSDKYIERLYLMTYLEFNNPLPITFYDFVIKPTLTSGTSANVTPWKPKSQSFNIPKVTELKVYGANLFDVNKFEASNNKVYNEISFDDVEYASNGILLRGRGTDSYVGAPEYKIYIPGGKNVTIAWGVDKASALGEVIAFVEGAFVGDSIKVYDADYNKGALTFDMPYAGTYITLRFANREDNTVLTFSNVRVTITNNDKGFVPFEEAVSMQLPTLTRPLLGLSNGVADEMNFEDETIYRRVSSYNFEGKNPIEGNMVENSPFNDLLNAGKYIVNQSSITVDKESKSLTVGARGPGSDPFVVAEITLTEAPGFPGFTLTWDAAPGEYPNVLVYMLLNVNSWVSTPAKASANYSDGRCILAIPDGVVSEKVFIRFVNKTDQAVTFSNIRITNTVGVIPADGHSYFIPEMVVDFDAFQCNQYKLSNSGAAGTFKVSKIKNAGDPYPCVTFYPEGSTMNTEGVTVFFAKIAPHYEELTVTEEGLPLIRVRPGTQIEFENVSKSPVPSTITYNIIQEAAI